MLLLYQICPLPYVLSVLLFSVVIFFLTMKTIGPKSYFFYSLINKGLKSM